MSNTLQEGNTALLEHADTENAPFITDCASGTPLKRKHGPNQTYTVEPCDFKEARNELDLEMEGHWWGPMPIDAFLGKFLSCAEAPLPSVPVNAFEDVPKDGPESARYGKFIDAIQGWMPGLQAVNTSTKEDTATNVTLKTDIAIYERKDGVKIPERTDFARMELWMEFKSKTQGAAFRDPKDSNSNELFIPHTVEGSNTRGQMAHYAGAQHSLQFRHFSFSILVEGDYARFLRWERAGTIVTAAFDYRQDPNLMAEFLWRFNHLSAGQRGHDETVQLACLLPEDNVRVREMLGIKDNGTPLYRYTIPSLEGEGYAYAPRPPATNQSLASRFTRTTPAIWIPLAAGDEELKSCAISNSSCEGNAYAEVKEGPWCEERLIFLKDTWRYLSNSHDVEIMPEHEIYKILHKNNTPNIPDLVAGGDVPGGMTRTQELVDEEWLRGRPEVCPFQHYRLVHGVVGRPLVKFDSTKQLVTGVLDALKAHSHAFEVVGLLHRDISMGNIILTDEDKGLLIDWEMAKKVNEIGRRRPDRTGTWQFMSANLLENPRKTHTFTDDLESFLHVLGWIALRYVPAHDKFLPTDRAQALRKFDEYVLLDEHDEQGGHGKSEALRGGSYPWPKFKAKYSTPLPDLIMDLSMPFKSLYTVRPPTTKDREKISNSTNQSDRKLGRLRNAIDEYDEDIEKLQSSTFFIDEIQEALDKKSWPTGDQADPNLPIASLTRTTRMQRQRQTTRRLDRENMFEDSRGLSRSSKRTLSPPPDPRSSKRRRSALTPPNPTVS